MDEPRRHYCLTSGATPEANIQELSLIIMVMFCLLHKQFNLTLSFIKFIHNYSFILLLGYLLTFLSVTHRTSHEFI